MSGGYSDPDDKRDEGARREPDETAGPGGEGTGSRSMSDQGSGQDEPGGYQPPSYGSGGGDSPSFGTQPPPYGDQSSSYGSPPSYGQQPQYGQQPYDQQQYGQQPGYGQPYNGGGVPQPYGQPQYGGGYGQAQENESTAITALIVSIAALVLFCYPAGIVSLILARSSKRKIEESGGRLGGSGMVTAATVLSWISIAIMVLLLLGFVGFGLLGLISSSGSS
jgi:hypothetical protein